MPFCTHQLTVQDMSANILLSSSLYESCHETRNSCILLCLRCHIDRSHVADFVYLLALYSHFQNTAAFFLCCWCVLEGAVRWTFWIVATQNNESMANEEQHAVAMTSDQFAANKHKQEKMQHKYKHFLNEEWQRIRTMQI